MSIQTLRLIVYDEKIAVARYHALRNCRDPHFCGEQPPELLSARRGGLMT